MDLNVKKLIESLYDIVEIVAKAIGETKEQYNISDSFKNEVDFEICRYLVFLSLSDNKVDEREIEFIREYCCTNVTSDQIIDILQTKEEFWGNFMTYIPIPFRILVKGDCELIKGGDKPGYGKTFLEAYKMIGEAFIASDGDVNIHESLDIKYYTEALEKYMLNAFAELISLDDLEGYDVWSINNIWIDNTNSFRNKTMLTNVFYDSSYKCPICHRNMYKTIFYFGLEPRIITSVGVHFMKRVFTCPDCYYFATAARDRLGDGLVFEKKYYSAADYMDELKALNSWGTTEPRDD